MTSLGNSKCKPCEGGVDPLKADEVEAFLKQLKGWAIVDGSLTKNYTFRNYHETIAFVNASAWISHREDHHPDLTVGYSTCRVAYITHAIGGLSANDFICAAKLDALFDL